MANVVSRFNEFAAHPPLWMRILIVPLFALIALSLAGKRGWAVGAIAAVVYAGIALPVAVDPAGTVAWSRRHPLLDGAILGPLLFLALAYLAHWRRWVCMTVGLAVVALGAAGGAQRARRRTRHS